MESGSKLGPLDGALLAIALLGIGIGVTVQVAVVPRFLEMYQDFGSVLPMATRIAVSPAFAWGSLLLVGALAGGGAALGASGRTAYGRAALASAVLVALLIVACTVAALYLPIFLVAEAIRA